MNVLNRIKNTPLLLCVKAIIAADRTRHRVKQTLMGGVTLLLSSAARADDDLAGMAINALNGFISLKDPLIKSSFVIGLILIGSGIFMLAAKKNNHQIKAWHIALAFVCGAALIAIDQVASKTQKQMGLTPVS